MPTFAAHIARRLRLCLSACLLLLPLGSGAAADDYYKGKSITFVIGSAVGGGYDTYSRLLASHLGQHLAGRPSVVPQNMPGAQSVRAANYLANIAPKDGTALGMLDEAIHLNQILGTQEPRPDIAKFNWIGRILANSAVLFARRDAPVQTIQDAFERPLIVSASGTASRLNWTVLKRLLGVKFTLINGYQGSNDSLLALMRGEVEALSMPWTILRTVGEHLIRDREVNLLLQTGAEKDAELPQVPRMIDLARTDDERSLLTLFSSPSVIGRSVVAAPGTPPARVEELRRAFLATIDDPAFRADLEQAKLEISPLSGEALQAAIASTAGLSPALINQARRVAGVGEK
jgi:tripartite-type tricarboxylate transporter receptor subunit TctC